MTKAVSIFMIALMAVQLIWPLGLPGLKKRGDFWKLALLAMVIPKGRLSREGGRQRRRAVTEARRTRKAGGGMAAMRRPPPTGGCGDRAFASAKPCGATFRRNGRKWQGPPLASRLIDVPNSAT